MAKAKKKAVKKTTRKTIPDTHFRVVFDRSGSMQSMWTEAVNGFTNFVNDQKKVPGKAWLTTAMFDSPKTDWNTSVNLFRTPTIIASSHSAIVNDPGYFLAHDNVAIKEADPLRVRDYPPRNMTALYDAIGKTITDGLAKKLKRGSKTMLVIITDGQENSSHEYTHEAVTALIKRVQAEHKWEVIFLGANIDAKVVGAGLGIMMSKTATFEASGRGATVMSNTVNLMATNYRGAVGAEAMAAYDSIDLSDVYATEDKKLDPKASSTKSS